MIRLYPAKAFYKVVTNLNTDEGPHYYEDTIEEISYISADETGNFFKEVHKKDGTIEKFRLVEERI